MYSLCTENLINLHRTETWYNKRKKHFPAAVWLRVSATAHFCGCWLTAVLQVVIFVLWLICLKLYNEISPRSHCPAFLFAYIKLSSDRKCSDPGTERERYVTETVWWTFLSAWWENVNSSKLPWKPDLWGRLWLWLFFVDVSSGWWILQTFTCVNLWAARCRSLLPSVWQQ